MAPKLVDPLKDLKEARKETGELSAAQIVGAAPRPSMASADPIRKVAKETTSLTPVESLEARCKKDFRVFLTVIWRHLLGVDPSPIQLDLAWYLQHGPDRAIIMAFRGFSKSWITGAYALWRLYCDPDEKVMVVSGSLKRAIATTNWALQLIMTLPLLKPLIPKPSFRQSGQMFDVGNCIPAQSASFSAFGIGGQLVGFRGSLIIPDDVETQTNSLTVVMREKIEEAVKEFESVLTPGGQIKYLGTPHDVDSLYMKLLRLRDQHGRPVYGARIWPAKFPSEEEMRAYGPWLAPYVTAHIQKHGPSVVGKSTMPNRFTDDDLEKRRAAMGNSEFRLQFMLDLTGISLDKYPLRLKDLTVTDLDDRRGPEQVVWGNTQVHRDLPVMGFDGDFYHAPVSLGDPPTYEEYQKVVGYVDSSGRGANETSLSIVGLLYGRAFWLHLWASRDGYSPETLRAVAQACVRFRVHTLYLEDNFGDGMFTSLLRPVLVEAWNRANAKLKASEQGGTSVEEVKSGRVQKELRMLSVLEPIVQQHRLVVSRKVVEWDWQSIQSMEGEDTRHRYAWGYQFTHVTRERDCLAEDDRLESLAGALGQLSAELGVDPSGMSARARDDKYNAWIAKLMADAEDDLGMGSGPQRNPNRPVAADPQSRSIRH